MSGPSPGSSRATPRTEADVEAAIERADAAGITSKMTPEEKNLNVRDALAFLDAVKSTFADQPDVYNRFLDIMKDFKTQRINTPGVIDRVSELFKDHARLIQDFNTFLPAGYRIHLQGPSQQFPDGSLVVSTPNDRVEYKSGEATDLQNHHTTQSGTKSATEAPLQTATVKSEPAGTQATPSSKPEPSSASVDVPLASSKAQPQNPPSAHASQQPEPVSQQSAATTPAPSDATTPVENPESKGSAPGQTSRNDEGLVPLPQPTPAIRAMPEFNHAVDFVNRIKTRFQDGTTYSQFLSILQHYQMERKSIQQVHSEVTALFAGAPDLLDDFKTFLPERIDNQPGLLLNGAGAQQPAPPNARGPPAAGSSRHASMGQAGQPPTSAGTSAGKRKRESDQARAAPVTSTGPARPVKRSSGHGDGRTNGNGDMPGHSDVEAPYSNLRANGADGPAVGPAQVHAPIPAQLLPPHPGRLAASPEEHMFFDKVSRYVEDHSTYQEFLKVLNLYSQEIIDLPTLVNRAQVFLSNAPDLFNEFKNIVGWKDDTYYKGSKIVNGKLVIVNVPATKQDGIKPDLENAETCGPSYRKLPESATKAPCSGRDALCNEVLNDNWVCHSSAAYEEGFIPTPKNEWEQAMHGVEEERYEYDYHIEANLRTIGLLEPIINRIQQMQPHEREAFCLKPGLGGQSKSIYQGTIKKIYGNENGQQVITALHDNPIVATPLVMTRLKQKDEEWKRALREWTRVWREVDRKNYYKALDPQGVSLRAADKRITPKLLVTEIETVRREQQQIRLARARGSLLPVPPTEQLSYTLGEEAIWFDVMRLIISYLDRTTSLSENDKARVEHFLRPFLGAMFAINQETLDAFLTPPERPSQADLGSDAGSDNETASQTEEAAAPPPPSRRGPKKTKKEIADLRRRTLQRTAANRGRRGRGGASHSAVSSREGTPDVEPSENGTPEPSTSYGSPEPASSDMMDLDAKEPVPATASGLQGMEGVETVSTDRAGTPDDVSSTPPPVDFSEPPEASKADTSASAARAEGAKAAAAYQAATSANLKELSWSREQYNFFCGTPHYCLLRVFETMVYRLQKIKDAADAIAVRDQGAKFSVSEEVLQEIRAKPKTIQTAYQLYTRLLVAVEQHWDSPSSTEAHLEDAIRKMFGISGYWFYTIDKLMALLCKFALNCIADPGQQQIFDLLKKDREMPSPTRSQAVMYREDAQVSLGPEENVYRICWEPRRSRLSFQLLGKDELQKQDEERAQERWEAYMTSYMNFEETPGIDKTIFRVPYLKRCIDAGLGLEDHRKRQGHSGMQMKFCLRTLRKFFEPHTEDWFARPVPKRNSPSKNWVRTFEDWHSKTFNDLPEPKAASNEKESETSTLEAGKAKSEDEAPKVDKEPEAAADESTSMAMEVDEQESAQKDDTAAHQGTEPSSVSNNTSTPAPQVSESPNVSSVPQEAPATSAPSSEPTSVPAVSEEPSPAETSQQASGPQLTAEAPTASTQEAEGAPPAEGSVTAAASDNKPAQASDTPI